MFCMILLYTNMYVPRPNEIVTLKGDVIPLYSLLLPPGGNTSEPLSKHQLHFSEIQAIINKKEKVQTSKQNSNDLTNEGV